MNRWHHVPASTFIGALLRAPLRLIPGGTVVKVRSGLNAGMRWIVGSGTHGCWLGHYESEKQREIGRLVVNGMRVFDIGAHAGFYTLAFARLVGPAGHVWAFEPFAENVQNLRTHVALNRLHNVTVVQAAVSRDAGLDGFAAHESNFMGRLAECTDYVVPTVSVDALCAKLCNACPDVMKIDVEGAEAAVLEGAEQTLSQGRPVIILSTHGREQERKCIGILRDHGYELFHLDRQAIEDDCLRNDEVIAIHA